MAWPSPLIDDMEKILHTVKLLFPAVSGQDECELIVE